MNFDKELNARSLSCPLPIVKTKKTLNDMESGQVLKVISTDSGSIKDMAAFAEQTEIRCFPLSRKTANSSFT